MLPHDHGDRGTTSTTASTSTSTSTSKRLIGREGLGRGTMAAENTRGTRRGILLVFTVIFLGAAVVVAVAGGYRRPGSVGPPRTMDPSALSSTPATGLRSAPPGDSDSDQQSTTAAGSVPGTLPAEIGGGETRGAGRAGQGEGTGTELEPGLAVRSEASGDRVAVYVYDGIPELDHSDLVECYREENGGVAPWQDEQADMAQDMGEIWLHRAVLAHPWRVFDPEEADVFFVPIYPILSMKLALAGERPWAPVDMDKHKCKGVTHYDRMTIAVDYLVRSSLFFNRFGGADHVVVCAWWNCRMALNPSHRMLLRRTVVGINERIPAWTRWGCGDGRALTVPYTPSSVLTTEDEIGGFPANDRDIPFFFVGTARGRPERENLDVVMDISEESIVLLGGDGSNWGMNSTEYAAHMSRSRFCFCPRGDTASSRRIFDALAAGCIPIVTEGGVNVLPFVEVGLDYSEFALVVDKLAFSTREGVEKVTRDALARSEPEQDELLRGVRKGVSSVVYGVTRGPELEDMRPFLGTATKFLEAASLLTGAGGDETGADDGKGGMWSCPKNNLPEKLLASRTSSNLPPVGQLSHQWLAETETIIDKERSLLFCAPPNTGSLQFRMLAKRMKGISHWPVHDDRSLLFDRDASGLELLDAADQDLLAAIYQENGSGWIKIVVVRDPVTRLLSAYLSLVKTWRAGLGLQPHPLPPGEAVDGAGAPPESSQHDRQLRQQRRQNEELDLERRRLEQVRDKGLLPGVGTTSEWDLFDAVVGKRRRQRRRRGLRERQEGENGADAGEGEGFHQREGGGGGGGGGGSGAGDTGGEAEGEGTPAEMNRDSGSRPDHRQQVQHRGRGRHQQRRENELADQAKEGSEPGNGGDNRKAHFWEGPGGWNGPVGAPASAERAAGVGEGGGGGGRGDTTAAVDGGGNDSDVAVGMPTFLEVLDTLKDGVWKAPAAFRPAVSMCGQRNSPFDTIIPFETLQKTSTEVLKSLPGGVWEAFGSSGWGPDGDQAFMEFDYGEAASAWRTSSSDDGGGGGGGGGGGDGSNAEVVGEGDGVRRLAGEQETDLADAVAVEGGIDGTVFDATEAQREREIDQEAVFDVTDDFATPLPRRARDLFDGEDPCAWVEFYGSLETLEVVGRLYEMDYKFHRWYRLDPWRERLQACLQR